MTDAVETARPPRIFAGLRTVSLLTLLSRILGLLRDTAMAALFGNGPLLDAFTVALRIPNLARRLFGEGALTAAFLPIFIRELEWAGRDSAWKLASAVLNLLAAALLAVVLIGELLLWGLSSIVPAGDGRLLLGLTAVMLPYLLLICLVAQVSAVLHALRHFTAPAFSPIVLNVVWILSVAFIASLNVSATRQIYFVAGSVVLGGMLQLAVLMPALFRLGFHYSAGWQTAHRQLGEILRAMLPVVAGLSITQINAMLDSVIAWSFSRPEAGTAGSMQFLEAGTASALFFGQRMYQFPLGLLGVTLGTVLFPLLARHAERGRFDLLRRDLDLGLRWMIVIGLPASAGLALLAAPITALLFQHGAFDANDARQTVEMIRAYAVGVWAYCGLLIIHRGYYAAGDRLAPLRIGLWAVLLNLALNFALLRPLGGQGLAAATSLTAMVQVGVAAWMLQQRIGDFDWRGLRSLFGRSLLATLLMSLVCWQALDWLPTGRDMLHRSLRVALPLLASLALYLGLARMLKMNEVWLLLRSENRSSGRDESSDDSD